MVKTVEARGKPTDAQTPPRTHCRPKQTQRFCSELDQKCVQFFQFLKDWQNAPPPHQGSPRGKQQLVAMGQQLMRFFNGRGPYSREELESHVVCLANLFNVLGDDIEQLRFERHFRSKLRRFVTDLAEEPATSCRSPKLHAVLYLLVVLIYRERLASAPPLGGLTHSLLSDQVLVRSLLSLGLPGDKKTSKFFGIVMVYLASKRNAKKVSELLVSSILRNLGRIEHQPSRVNLIAYLRTQKNIVKINFKDVTQGGVFDLLLAQSLQPHPIHAHAGLDYLLHLILLFPSLTHQLSPSYFSTLLEQPQHSIYQNTLSSLLQAAIKYHEPTAKTALLNQLMQIRPASTFLTLKVAQILMEQAQVHGETMQLVQKGYFQPLLQIIHPHSDHSLLISSAHLYAQTIKTMAVFNMDLSRCLLHRLASRLNLINSKETESILQKVRENMTISLF